MSGYSDFRVVKQTFGDTVLYRIHEVFYDEGKIIGSVPAEVAQLSVEGLIHQIEHLQKAFAQPVLDGDSDYIDDVWLETIMDEAAEDVLDNYTKGISNSDRQGDRPKFDREPTGSGGEIGRLADEKKLDFLDVENTYRACRILEGITRFHEENE